MERLKRWWTQVPPRLSRNMAWFYLAGAACYSWWTLHRDATAFEAGRQMTGILIALFFLAMALGSLLPEDRGGFAVRSASRWLAIPLIIGVALYLAEIYQGSGARTLLGLAVFMLVVIALSWFVRRWRES
jgi:hypothetical protein